MAVEPFSVSDQSVCELTDSKDHDDEVDDHSDPQDRQYPARRHPCSERDRQDRNTDLQHHGPRCTEEGCHHGVEFCRPEMLDVDGCDGQVEDVQSKKRESEAKRRSANFPRVATTNTACDCETFHVVDAFHPKRCPALPPTVQNRDRVCRMVDVRAT
jgi:hypothetical protein